MSAKSVDEEGEGIAVLGSEAGNHREDALDEAAAVGTVGTSVSVLEQGSLHAGATQRRPAAIAASAIRVS